MKKIQNNFLTLFIFFIISKSIYLIRLEDLTMDSSATNDEYLSKSFGSSDLGESNKFSIQFGFEEIPSEKIDQQKLLSNHLLFHHTEKEINKILVDYILVNQDEYVGESVKHDSQKLKIDLDTPSYANKPLLGATKNQVEEKKDQAPKEDVPLETIKPCNEILVEIIDGDSKEVGKGAFGRVFTPNIPGADIVIKEMKVGLQREKLIRSEILISLMFPDSDHIANFYTACYIDREFEKSDLNAPISVETERFYYLFMEECSGNFDDWYFSKVQEGDVLMVERIIHQIADGYKEMHHKDVLHIDNHIGNYMICDDKIKIIDFGVAVLRSKLRRQQKVIQENLEYNELFNFFKLLLQYKKIKDKRLHGLLERLRKSRAVENPYNSVNEFIQELEEVFEKTDNLLKAGMYDENESVKIWISCTLFWLLLSFFLNIE